MPLQVVNDAGEVVELPEGVSFEKVEDIASFAEKAKNHDTLKARVDELDNDPNYKNWQNTRKLIDDDKEQIKTLKERLAALGGDKPQPGEPIKTEQVGDVVNDILSKRDQENLGKRVEKLIKDSAPGDESRQKVIKEKFDMLSAGKQITSEDEAQAILSDAVFLANRNREGGVNPIQAINAHQGSGGGGPIRENGEDKAKAVSNLQAMGYQFKGDPKKYSQ